VEIGKQFVKNSPDACPELVEVVRSTPREKYLWDMICKNWVGQHKTELSWIRQIRQELGEMEAARQWAKS